MVTIIQEYEGITNDSPDNSDRTYWKIIRDARVLESQDL